MQKSIFPTKVKDGLFVLTVVLVVMFGSLYVDAVKGVLRGEKIRASVYLEGASVEETLTDGNMVTVYRRTVGKIETVGFYAAETVRPSEASSVKLDELAGTPEQLERLRSLQKELRAQPEIVTGVRLDVLLYKDLIGPMWQLFGEKSEAKIAAAGMLGEPYLQIYPGGGSGGIADGTRLGFPKNDPAAGENVPVFGTELLSAQEVALAQQRLTAFQAKQREFEKVLEEIAANPQSEPETAPATATAPIDDPSDDEPAAPAPSTTSTASATGTTR